MWAIQIPIPRPNKASAICAQGRPFMTMIDTVKLTAIIERPRHLARRGIVRVSCHSRIKGPKTRLSSSMAWKRTEARE